LYLSQVFALVGFSLVMASDYWSTHQLIGIGLLMMLLVLPFYVGESMHRMRRIR
jgi:hypothetical protein